MTIHDFLFTLFTSGRFNANSSVLVPNPDHDIDAMFYDLRKTPTTYEVPVGVTTSSLNNLKFAGIPVYNDSQCIITAPKTPLAFLSSALSYGRMTAWYENEHSSTDKAAYYSCYGFLMKADGTPILEATREISAEDGRVTAYLLRINRKYLDEDTRLADYLKGSIIKGGCTTNIGGMPISVIVDTVMENPIRKISPVMDTPEEHQEEVERVLSEHTDDITDYVIAHNNS